MAGYRSKAAMALSGYTVLVPDSPIKVLSEGVVDGVQWYTVSCLHDASIWIRTTYAEDEGVLWFDNIDEHWVVHYNVLDVHEQVLTAATLRWT
jgi:hypothetical protein